MMAIRNADVDLVAVMAVAALVFVNAAPIAAQPAPSTANECLTCHAGLDARLAAPALQFSDDIHRSRGFACVDCHGGDPTTSDQARAKAPAAGYRGAPAGGAVIEVCARCHSDAAFMRRFAPRQRVDQASEYAVSIHGQRLDAGDPRVPTCAGCHGAHGIRQVSDALSPVFPLNVTATCARCHSDSERMSGYTLPGGSPVPTSQRADYERSVHFGALTTGNDLSAPTCNDCHGSHGAAPPGVDAVVNVCGTCHAIFAERFGPTVHGFLFEQGCVECHGNHAVEPASDEMLGVTEPATCPVCHSEGDTGWVAAASMRASIERLKDTMTRAEALVERANNAGMEMSDQELALGEALNALTLARTEIHTFDVGTVDSVVGEGLTTLATVEEGGQAALAELRFRRQGLAAALIAILILVVALGLKIRQLDRRRGAKVQGSHQKL